MTTETDTFLIPKHRYDSALRRLCTAAKEYASFDDAANSYEGVDCNRRLQEDLIKGRANVTRDLVNACHELVEAETQASAWHEVVEDDQVVGWSKNPPEPEDAS